jgi:hypothetical protein
MKVVVAIVALLLLVAVGGISESHAQACSNQVFCSGWHAVCKRTLPPGGTPKVCQERRAKCLSSGCYFFNVPRPRCKNNPEDLALTTACQR